ncbi:MAG: O-antigen ligase family protein [Deinococcales bacterium]
MKQAGREARPAGAASGPTGAVRSPAGWLEDLFVVAALLAFAGAFSSLVSGATTAATDSNPAVQLLFGLIYAVTLVLVVRRRAAFTRYLLAEKVLVALVALALLSIVWAALPAVAARRAVALAGTTLFGVYLAMRYSLGRLLEIVGWLGVIALTASLVAALAFPAYGVMHDRLYAGAWRGVFVHKDVLGRVAALAAVTFLLLALRPGPRRRLFMAALPLAALLLVLSQSATGYVVLAVCVAVLPALRVLRWPRKRMLAGAAIAAGALVVAGAVVALFAGAILGRSFTLTGRTSLWQLCLEAVGRRPWLGYGYGSFWNGLDGPSARIWAQLTWQPPNAHNGAIDILLGVGAVGLALFLVVLVRAVVASARAYRSGLGHDAVWPLIFFVFLVVSNITYTTMFLRNDIYWVLQVALTLQIVMRQREGDGEAALADTRT